MPQELLKHALLDCLVGDTDLFSLRLSNFLKMTKTNTIAVPFCPVISRERFIEALLVGDKRTVLYARGIVLAFLLFSPTERSRLTHL